MLQATYLHQSKDIVEHLRASKQVLIKYIEGDLSKWSTFIGDNCLETYQEMLGFAKDIAKRHGVSLSDIFVNQQLDDREQEEFREMLTDLHRSFSGKSVLEQCIEGHNTIKYLIRDAKQGSSPISTKTMSG